MKGKLRISLKANEKIYINGAVVKVDRKTSIEFLNDVQFLLENHVMLPENASTPLRQLYESERFKRCARHVPSVAAAASG